MKRWKSWLFLLGLLGLLALLDRQLWATARLTRYVGRYTGLSGAVDDAVQSQFGEHMEWSRMEEDLARAETPEDYGALLQKLSEHLGSMGRTQDRVALMEKAVVRFPGASNKPLLAAHTLLAKRYAKAGEREKLREILDLLVPVAEGPPIRMPLLKDILDWAHAGGLDAFVERLGERAHALPGLRADERLDLLAVLQRHYSETGDDGKLAALAAIQEAYTQKASIAKLVERRQNEIRRRLKQKEWDEALQEVADTMKAYPAYADMFFGLGHALAKAAVRRGDKKMAVRIWDCFQGVSPPAQEGRARKAAHEMARNLLPFVLQAVAPDAFVPTAQKALERYPGLRNRYGHYIEGEVWVRGEQEGPPPKLLYVLRFQPDASMTLDGKLDEPVYGELDPMDGPFWLHAGTKAPLTEAGELKLKAKLFYTKTHLWMGIESPEPNMRGLQAGERGGRVSEPWKSDCIEFYLDSDRAFGRYQQWIVNANGGYEHLFLKNAGIEYTGRREKRKAEDPIETAVTHQRDAYTLEARIPLSLLPLEPPFSGRLMNGNLRRLRPTGPGMEAPEPYRNARLLTISWTKTGHGHNTHRFAFLRFE